jgi:hypothetical protein
MAKYNVTASIRVTFTMDDNGEDSLKDQAVEHALDNVHLDCEGSIGVQEVWTQSVD